MHVRLLLQDHPKPGADQLVIVDENQIDHAAALRGSSP
jgi:hypothetical protein